MDTAIHKPDQLECTPAEQAKIKPFGVIAAVCGGLEVLIVLALVALLVLPSTSHLDTDQYSIMVGGLAAAGLMTFIVGMVAYALYNRVRPLIIVLDMGMFFALAISMCYLLFGAP